MKRHAASFPRSETLDLVAGLTPPCPVDRVPRRRRNQICIAVIALGALNFLVYTLTYAALGGDAYNGHVDVVAQPDGTRAAQYYVRGHFIRSFSGQERVVTQGLWIYSYLHSITVPLTSGAMILSMLVLARPHIIATMRDRFISGPAFVVAFGTVIMLLTTFAVVVLTWGFFSQLPDT